MPFWVTRSCHAALGSMAGLEPQRGAWFRPCSDVRRSRKHDAVRAEGSVGSIDPGKGEGLHGNWMIRSGRPEGCAARDG